jgi:hypothetical protein
MGRPLSPVPTQGREDKGELYQATFPIPTPHGQAKNRKDLAGM